MQRIKLMTDSACDLPGSLARQLGIEVIPIPIAVDGKGYLEGVDFTPREFYTILQQAKQIPTTSQISPVTYCERYHAAYQQGYTDVILMGISSTASATYLRSKDAADLFFENCPQAKESFRIHIIDSKTFSLGYGYPLTQAAQMIQDGKTAEEILAYRPAGSSASTCTSPPSPLNSSKSRAASAARPASSARRWASGRSSGCTRGRSPSSPRPAATTSCCSASPRLRRTTSPRIPPC